MKKWLYILLLPFMLCACEPDEYYGGYYGDDYTDSTTDDEEPNYDGIRVYEGYSYNLVYTIRR